MLKRVHDCIDDEHDSTPRTVVALSMLLNAVPSGSKYEEDVLAKAVLNSGRVGSLMPAIWQSNDAWNVVSVVLHKDTQAPVSNRISNLPEYASVGDPTITSTTDAGNAAVVVVGTTAEVG